MKIYISADLEGLADVFASEEGDCEKGAWESARQQMTHEVAAACRGALAGGASAVVVRDAHGRANNLVHAHLPEKVELVRGWSEGPGLMMEGLDESFDGVAYVGYHGKSGDAGNPLSHTMTGLFYEVRVNGRVMSEFEINSLQASRAGVPVVFLSGDDAICSEARAWHEGIETLATKRGSGGAVLSRHPKVICDEIEDRMRSVVESMHRGGRPTAKPLPQGFEMELVFRVHKLAHTMSFYPGAKRRSDRTVAFQSGNWDDVAAFFLFANVVTAAF